MALLCLQLMSLNRNLAGLCWLLKGFLVISLESVFYYLFKKLIYLSLAALGLHCCVWVSWGYSLVVVHGLLIVAVSRCRAQAPGCTDFSS